MFVKLYWHVVYIPIPFLKNDFFFLLLEEREKDKIDGKIPIASH